MKFRGPFFMDTSGIRKKIRSKPGFPARAAVRFTPDNDQLHSVIGEMTEASVQLGWTITSSGQNFVRAKTTPTKSWGEEITVWFNNNSVQILSRSVGGQIVDWGRNRRNIEQLLRTIEFLPLLISEKELQQKEIERQRNLAADETNPINPPRKWFAERTELITSLFIPIGRFTATPILTSLNLSIFILMVLTGVDFGYPDYQDLLSWGANLRSLTLNGDWWRLLSCTVVHGGYEHLLLNVYTLILVSAILEPVLGAKKVLLAYLFTGICASMTSVSWYESTASVGASGAIFGLYGVLTALIFRKVITTQLRKNILLCIGVLVAHSLLSGLTGPIDNAAHIGGYVSGLVLGQSYSGMYLKAYSGLRRIGNLALSGAVLVGITSFVIQIPPYDVKFYKDMMEQFDVYEKEALHIIHWEDGTDLAEQLIDIEDRILYSWQQNLEILEEIEEINGLPDNFRERNAVLTAYCNSRIKSVQLLYASLKGDTNRQIKDSVPLIDDSSVEVEGFKLNVELKELGTDIEEILQNVHENESIDDE